MTMRLGANASVIAASLRARRSGARPASDVVAFAAALLAVQLAVFLNSYASGEPLHVLHYDDEFRYHQPLIEAFAEGGLAGGFEAYSSATTPFFHMTFGMLQASTGLDPWGLRAINVLLSTLAATLMFSFLTRNTQDRVVAWLLAGAFALAPYCFGRAFVLLTESYALLWLLLAFIAFDRWMRTDSPLDVWTSAAFLSLAVLTRQHFLWITAWFGILTLARPMGSLGTRLTSLAAWTLPPLAFTPFLVAWHGFVPPSFQESNQATAANLRAVLFTYTTLGLYAGLLAPSRLIGFTRNRPAACLAAAGLAVALCVAVGMRFQVQGTDDGYLWRIAQHTPVVLGVNVLLAGLTAVGLVEVARAASDRRYPYILFVALFSLSFLLVSKNFQKYYEAQLLLVLIWDISREKARGTVFDQIGRAAWILMGVVYVIAKAPLR